MKLASCKLVSIAGFLCTATIAHARPSPVGSAFTYQGQLKQSGTPVDDTADFEFSLWDAASGPDQIGSTQPVNNVTITDGLFTVDLDFGASAFGTNARWLEIAVRSPAGSGTFTTLTPRQRIQPTPVAQFALAAPIPAGSVGSANLINDPASLFKVSGRVMTSSGGNIGIGTATPSQTLDVAGNLKVSGWIGTDVQAPVEIFANNTRGLKIEYASNTNGDTSINMIGGYSGNSVANGVFGATIAGGGFFEDVFGIAYENSVTADFGTIGGGQGNTSAGFDSTVSGGGSNTASGVASVVSGGAFNDASGLYSAIPGGSDNQAGGNYSFAAGRYAVVRNASQAPETGGDHGTFIWADSVGGNFTSTGPNQFLINASVGIGTAAPAATLSIYEPRESLTQTVFTQALSNAGVNIMTDYSDGAFTPGVFWSTNNNNAAKPKAGIYLKTTSDGSEMHFGTSNVYLTGITNDAMVIDPIGNIGIGTGLPTGRLHLAGPSPDIALKMQSAGSWTAGLRLTSSSVLSLFNGLNEAPRVSVDSSGEVGIGTTSPTNPLTINSSGTASGGVAGFNEVVANFRNTNGGHTAVSINDTTGSQDSILYFTSGGSPVWGIRNDKGVSNNVFEIRAHEFGANQPIMSMHYFQDGFAYTVFGSRLEPALDNEYTLGTITKRWKEVWAANPFIQTSDVRAKRDVQNITTGLEAIVHLRPVSYFWNNDADNAQRQLGLIAQEVALIVPEAVVAPTDPKTLYGMKYDTFIPLLIDAVQTQQHTIEQLREQNIALESRLAVLDQAVQQLLANQRGFNP